MPDAALSDMSLRDGASLQIEALSVAYATRTGWLQALDAVSLSIPPGGVLGLVGESGSGKSTVVLALLGLLGPSARVQARRLADIRKVHGHARQADVAAIMGVSQARVSKLESGDLSHTELGTLQSYVAALGGNLHIVAEFGESTVELTA